MASTPFHGFVTAWKCACDSLQMDLLAGRLSGSAGLTVKGDVLVNGAPIDFAAFRKTAAYVQQQDHLPPTETVKECLMFSAQLRLPRSMSRAAKEARVDSILDELVRPSPLKTVIALQRNLFP